MQELGRMIKKLCSKLFSRIVITGVLILIQAAWFWSLFTSLSSYAHWLNPLMIALSVIMCAVLIRQDSTAPEFKISWMVLFTLLLKGQMTHRATLGTDPRGNLTRIDNALAQMPQRLEAAKAQLDNLYQQQAAAKEEVGKPFLYEEELRSKNARLVELDTLLNIDGKGQAHTESVVAKSTRPSVLDNLKRPVQPRSTDKKPKQHEEVR